MSRSPRTSVDDWRQAHERFWASAPGTEGAAGAPRSDDELVVLERFRVLELAPPGPHA